MTHALRATDNYHDPLRQRVLGVPKVKPPAEWLATGYRDPLRRQVLGAQSLTPADAGLKAGLASFPLVVAVVLFTAFRGQAEFYLMFYIELIKSLCE